VVAADRTGDCAHTTRIEFKTPSLLDTNVTVVS
jgi:hypothetical protein